MKPFEAINHFEESHPYISSVGRGAVHFALSEAITAAGDKVGMSLRHGRHSSKNTATATFEKHPVLSAVAVSTIVPFAEELFWRRGSALLAEKLPDNSRLKQLIPLGALALFTAQHAGKDGLPLPQAIGGIIYQDTFNNRGLLHSTIAHATNNGLAVASHIIKRSRSKAALGSQHRLR